MQGRHPRREERDRDRHPDQQHHARLPRLQFAPRAGEERCAAVEEDRGTDHRRNPGRAGKVGDGVAEEVGEHVAEHHHRHRQRETDPELLPEHLTVRAVAGVPIGVGVVIVSGVPDLFHFLLMIVRHACSLGSCSRGQVFRNAPVVRWRRWLP